MVRGVEGCSEKGRAFRNALSTTIRKLMTFVSLPMEYTDSC